MVDGSLPASRAPFSKRSMSNLSFSWGAAGVMKPSHMRPAVSAVFGPEAAMQNGEGVSGRGDRRGASPPEGVSTDRTLLASRKDLRNPNGTVSSSQTHG